MRDRQWVDEKPRSKKCPIPASMLRTKQSQLLHKRVSEAPFLDNIQELHHNEYENLPRRAYHSSQNPEYLIDLRGRQ